MLEGLGTIHLRNVAMFCNICKIHINSCEQLSGIIFCRHQHNFNSLHFPRIVFNFQPTHVLSLVNRLLDTKYEVTAHLHYKLYKTKQNFDMSLPKISYGMCDNISCERIVKYFQYFQKNCTIPTMLGVRADALFEDYVGRQMVNRPSDPEFTVQFKTQLCPSSFMRGKMKL